MRVSDWGECGLGSSGGRSLYSLSYLEHSICWLENQLSLGTQLLVHWILCKQEQNHKATHTYERLLCTPGCVVFLLKPG